VLKNSNTILLTACSFAGFERNWWSDWHEYHLELFYCSVDHRKQLHNRRCMWLKSGGGAQKPETLGVWKVGGLKPSSLIEVYAYGCCVISVPTNHLKQHIFKADKLADTIFWANRSKINITEPKTGPTNVLVHDIVRSQSNHERCGSISCLYTKSTVWLKIQHRTLELEKNHLVAVSRPVKT